MDQTHFRWWVAVPGGWWREPEGRDAMTSHPRADMVACMQGDGGRPSGHQPFGVRHLSRRLSAPGSGRVGTASRLSVRGWADHPWSALPRCRNPNAMGNRRPDDCPGGLKTPVIFPVSGLPLILVFSPPESRPSRRLRNVRTRPWTRRRSRPRRCARGPGP
jgi:hypothetical protein